MSAVAGLGTKSIYIMDYWAHYRERFYDAGTDRMHLPDIICVMDDSAKREMIADGFDADKIKVTGNPYFDDFQKNITNNQEDPKTILFLSQPISDRRGEFGFDEFEVLSDLLMALRNLAVDFKVIIKQHPREDKGKFDGYLDKNVSVENEAPVETAVSRVGLIFGMNSMVLFQAAVAGKKVISYQPNLKTKDFLISNRFGLSLPVFEKSGLENALKEYFNGKFPVSEKAADGLIVSNATENVIKLIDEYEKR